MTMYQDGTRFSDEFIIDDWHRALDQVHDQAAAHERMLLLAAHLLVIKVWCVNFTLRDALLCAMEVITDEIYDLGIGDA